MKIHTPIFILGLLTFVTPFTGLPVNLKTIVIACYGLAIMILAATIKKKNSGSEFEKEFVEESKEEDEDSDNKTAEYVDSTNPIDLNEEKLEPSYEEITEEVQQELSEITEDENEKKSE